MVGWMDGWLDGWLVGELHVTVGLGRGAKAAELELAAVLADGAGCAAARQKVVLCVHGRRHVSDVELVLQVTAVLADAEHDNGESDPVEPREEEHKAPCSHIHKPKLTVLNLSSIHSVA